MILNNAARLSTLRGSRGRGSARSQLLLAQVKKERQAERDSHGEHRKNDQLAMSNSETIALDARERDQHDGGDQDVHAEERPNAVREQFAHEEREIQSMLQCPWNELRIRKKEAQDAEHKVKRFGLHPGILSEIECTQIESRRGDGSSEIPSAWRSIRPLLPG